MLCDTLSIGRTAYQHKGLAVTRRRHQRLPITHHTRLSTYCSAKTDVLTRAHDRSMKAPTGVEHASLYDQNNRQQQLGPSGVETFFVNKQGLKIATYFWPSDAPKDTKAIVLAVHGHGAHIQNEYLKRQVQIVLCLTTRVHSNFYSSL